MIQKLLDNRWEVTMFRSVDGKYTAAAKRPFKEQWKDIFEVVNQQGHPTGYPTDDFERMNYKGPRMPHRIASGETPNEALSKLVDQVLGLAEAPK